MKKVVDYSVYDGVPRFRFGDAVNLFYGYAPEPLHETSLIDEKRALQVTLFDLGTHHPDCPELELYNMNWVSREELLRAAEKLRMRPKLLYPDARQKRGKPGRPTYEAEIKKAYEALVEDGTIKHPTSKRACYPDIRSRTKTMFSLLDDRGLGDEAIRKAIKQEFDKNDTE